MSRSKRRLNSTDLFDYILNDAELHKAVTNAIITLRSAASRAAGKLASEVDRYYEDEKGTQTVPHRRYQNATTKQLLRHYLYEYDRNDLRRHK